MHLAADILAPTPEPVLAAKPSLAGLGRDGLAAALAAVGVPDRQLKMRVGQLWSWLYVRGARTFDEMSDVSKELRARLAGAYTLERPQVAAAQVSADGTRKWLIRMQAHGHEARPSRSRAA